MIRGQGYCVRLLHPRNNILCNPIRKFSSFYGCGELCWYLNPQATMRQIIHYSKNYEKYAEDTYAFYGRRINTVDGNQLVRIANILRSDPNSRRCVLALWAANDLVLQNRQDLPCTISWKFTVHEGQLNTFADMRSNDAWLGMPNDIFVNTCIHTLMCKLTGYDMGFYQHQVADIHLYERDWSRASHAIEAPSTYASTPLGGPCDWTDVSALLDAEQKLRLTSVENRFTDDFFNFVMDNLK